jgi:hypothetical protein
MFIHMKYGVYMFFAILMILSIPYVFFLIPGKFSIVEYPASRSQDPETKGIPLERMDELFEIKPAYKAHKTMVQRLAEVDHDDMSYGAEKPKADDRMESV